MPKHIRCISCDEDRPQPVCVKNSYQVVECQTCGLQYIDPVPTSDELYDLYRCGTLIQESGTEQQDKDGLIEEPLWKVQEFSRIVQQISELTTPGRILDVGSLWGLFLRIAKEDGWETYGIEPWDKAVEYSRKKMGLHIKSGVLEEVAFPRNYFDAAVILDVLEHCPNPKDDLAKINGFLKEKGILCVLAPNAQGLLPLTSSQWHRLLGQSWTYLTPPFHLYNFTPSTLTQLLNNEGFEVINIDHLSIGSRIEFAKENISLREFAKKTVSYIGKNLRMGDRMVIYARKQNWCF